MLGRDLLGSGIEGPLGMGFLDEEDGGVLRCYDCMYETWDGKCVVIVECIIMVKMIILI